VPPTPIRPPHRTSRKRTTEPSKEVRTSTLHRAGRRCDVGLVGRISSITSGPVQPSLPLYHHPRHCSTILGDVGARDDKTSPHPLLCILRPSVSRTLESAYRRRPNGKLPHDHRQAASGQVQDSPRHMARARFIRMTINSTVLYTIPPYVALELCDTIENCLPLAYETRRRSPSRGGGGGHDG
jgi:hypothetical protein